MKLKDWLEDNDMRVSDLARKMNITHCVALRWCKGTVPRQKYLKEIYEITKGKVKPEDFYFGCITGGL